MHAESVENLICSRYRILCYTRECHCGIQYFRNMIEGCVV